MLGAVVEVVAGAVDRRKVWLVDDATGWCLRWSDYLGSRNRLVSWMKAVTALKMASMSGSGRRYGLPRSVMESMG